MMQSGNSWVMAKRLLEFVEDNSATSILCDLEHLSLSSSTNEY
jgi:hypothetical protein